MFPPIELAEESLSKRRERRGKEIYLRREIARDTRSTLHFLLHEKAPPRHRMNPTAQSSSRLSAHVSGDARQLTR
jgi:hypothetical protein